MALIPSSLAPIGTSCAFSTNTGTQAAQSSGLRRLPKTQNTQTSTNIYRLLPAINRLRSITMVERLISCTQKDDSIHCTTASNTSAISVVRSDSARTIRRSSSIAIPKDTMLTFMSVRCIIIQDTESYIYLMIAGQHFPLYKRYRCRSSL